MSNNETIFVSFSGGRTSGYMCKWLIDNIGLDTNLVFIFANTGQEHEETLIFVDKCDKNFGLDLVWVEAVVHLNERKGATHKVVDFESASRKGEPFEQCIKKYGIPNASFMNCNRELKINAIQSYKKSMGFRSKHKTAIGIRVDEIDRMSPTAKKNGLFYPLISLTPTNKSEIRHWWKSQNFDLNIPEHLGNCVTCWKKSKRKLMTIARDEPERFDFFKRMEKENPDAGAGAGGRVFFRQYESAEDIIRQSKEPFVGFVDTMPELQLVMFDVNPIDLEDSCGDSCEAA